MAMVEYFILHQAYFFNRKRLITIIPMGIIIYANILRQSSMYNTLSLYAHKHQTTTISMIHKSVWASLLSSAVSKKENLKIY